MNMRAPPSENPSPPALGGRAGVMKPSAEVSIYDITHTHSTTDTFMRTRAGTCLRVTGMCVLCDAERVRSHAPRNGRLERWGKKGHAVAQSILYILVHILYYLYITRRSRISIDESGEIRCDELSLNWRSLLAVTALGRCAVGR